MPKRYPEHQCELCGTLTKNIKYCSNECRTNAQYPNYIKPELKQCLNCNSDTYNPIFCSKSCAAKYNNTKGPKRKKKIWYCKICGEAKNRPSENAKTCFDCRSEIKLKYDTL